MANEEKTLSGEEIYQTLFQNAMDAIYIISSEGFEIVNPAFERLVGYSAAELCSADFNFFRLIHPEDIPLISRRQAAREKSQSLSSLYEFRIITKDGRIMHTEVNTVPLTGKKARTLGIIRDITDRKRAERTIQETNARLRSLVQAIPDVVYFKDAERRNMIVNRAYERAFGLEEAQIVGRRDEEFMPLEMAAACSKSDDAVFESGELRRFEESARLPDGRIVCFETLKAPILDSAGAVAGLVGVSRDMTASKSAEERIRASEEKFRRLFENSLDGIYQSAPDGRLLTANPALVKMFGFDTESEILASNARELYADPADRDAWAGRMELEGRVRNLEVRFKRRDGTTFVALENSRVILDKDGNVQCYEGILTDIAEHIKAVEELRKSEELYKTLFERANDGVFLLSPDATFIKTNKRGAEMIGYSREELVGKQLRELVAPEESETSKERWKALLNGQAFGPYERIFVKKDGTRFTAEINASVIFDFSGKPVFVQGVVRDISERKAKEEALLAALQEKETFLKEVHHRVKNNLQIVSSLISLQSRRLNDPRDVQIFKENQRRIRAMALIHEKLYQSKNLDQVDFGSYLGSLAANLLQTCQKNSDDIHFAMDAPDIALDIQTAIPCGLIVNELVSNALQHAFPNGRKGEVSISLRRDGPEFVLSVKDNGVGLPASIDLRQTESMGLQLVTTLVDQLEGRIELERGQETEFKIAFKELRYKPRI
jgi:PAS domain S-box-containing protein